MLKKLYGSLLVKFTSLFVLSLLLLYAISYGLLNRFFMQSLPQKSYEAMMVGFNDVWISIAFVFCTVFIVVFFLIRLFVKSITDEVEDINSYLEEINQKNYDAVLKIEHHLEFLQLSILLKNIVKRLKNKNK